MNTKTTLKTIVFIMIILGIVIGLQIVCAQQKDWSKETGKELIALSQTKWKWMAEKDVVSLNDLFHANAVFVHMGATMNKEQELNTIKSGGIHYKHTEIQETTVRFVEETAIVLAKVRLTAVVGGKEVVNPFMVTEVYVKIDNTWELASLSFTRLLGS